MTDPVAHAITVRGTGLASAAPDVFVVEVGAEVAAPAPGPAFADASAALRRMADAARVSGVGDEDLRSGEMSLWTDHDRDGMPSGYRATVRLEVHLRDLAGAGETLAGLVAAGGDAARVTGTRFEHSDLAALAEQARDAAFAEAARHAARFAVLAGRPLGGVVSVLEDETGSPAARPMAAQLLLDAGGPPVEAGALAVSASVTVSWAWG